LRILTKTQEEARRELEEGERSELKIESERIRKVVETGSDKEKWVGFWKKDRSLEECFNMSISWSMNLERNIYIFSAMIYKLIEENKYSGDEVKIFIEEKINKAEPKLRNELVKLYKTIN